MEQKSINQISYPIEKRTYTVPEIASILGISQRSAYSFCKNTKDFIVYHIGRSVRVNKASFDSWFSM